eukprot:CAMPEP_0119323778 /NCGR_PEP_ID=MMETSP1333-20130426/61586_1 /TAXON_ID=418940 /ORGANISM="Scyphosphaera apsteinii, Strain RCC1455" /LENGTH=42 /DNA_ID= /DNA_START= /DNA_END= /DNA_ORIENTATION=
MSAVSDDVARQVLSFNTSMLDSEYSTSPFAGAASTVDCMLGW